MLRFRFIVVMLLAYVQAALMAAEPHWQIRAGTAVSFPGVTVTDGKLSTKSTYGYGDIIACMEQQLNAEFVWQQFPTARLLHSAVQQTVDVLFPMGFTAERNAILQPSVYLVKEQDYWVYLGVAPDWQQKQLSVAVKQSSPQAEWLLQNGYVNIHQVYDYRQLLPLLRSGRVASITVPAAIAVEYQNEGAEGLSFKAFAQREAGFYLNHDFAAKHLPEFNQAVVACRHHASLPLL